MCFTRGLMQMFLLIFQTLAMFFARFLSSRHRHHASLLLPVILVAAGSSLPFARVIAAADPISYLLGNRRHRSPAKINEPRSSSAILEPSSSEALARSSSARLPSEKLVFSFLLIKLFPFLLFFPRSSHSHGHRRPSSRFGPLVLPPSWIQGAFGPAGQSERHFMLRRRQDFGFGLLFPGPGESVFFVTVGVGGGL